MAGRRAARVRSLYGAGRSVATNFFHGCVFALRNAKPFVCEITPYRFLKVNDLMILLGGEDHLVREDTPRKSTTRV
jgi:hypothetical protein